VSVRCVWRRFDFYDGGGLDIAVLGAAEIDAEGSVNVGVFAGLVKGVGGFVNISSTAKRLVFCCTLRAGGLAVAYSQAEGRLSIESEGKHAKFVHKLPPSRICFHGPSAIARGQEVLYVTERAVFRLTEEGLRLEELAPGISEADVLPHMGFTPLAGSEVRPMAAQHFES
jgi:acyl CoA:acetate/3-ketoacid CoA transferase